MKAVLEKLNDELLINLMNRSVPFTSHVQAAVAYAQGNHPFFQACKERNLRLTFYWLLDEDAGAVAPNLLADILTGCAPFGVPTDNEGAACEDRRACG